MTRLLFVGFLALLSMVAPSAGDWSNDLEEAQKIAAKEKKDLYLVFLSTDSSGACQQLEKRILSSDKFNSLAEEKFVLVKIDLPMKKRLQKENHEGLLQLANKFGVGGAFPVALYLDSRGRPYHREAGVMPGGPQEYAGHVLSMQKKRENREKALEETAKLSGLKKAEAMVELLKALPDEVVVNFYSEEMEELARLDPEDTLKFRKEKVMNHAYAELESSVKKVFYKDGYGEVVKLVDEFLEKHQPEGAMKQKVLFRKLAALNYDGQKESALKVADKIIAIRPDSSHGRFAAQIKAKIQKQLGR